MRDDCNGGEGNTERVTKAAPQVSTVEVLAND
jgi:hypothetical protein